MRIGPYRFAPGIVPTVAALAMLALLVSLGRWQVNRADEKTARQAVLDERIREAPFRLEGAIADPQALVFRRVLATGTYLPASQVFIDNRLNEKGRAGFHVVTPLRIEGASKAVLVNRGWIARDATYPKAPAAPVPPGLVTVHGLATVPPARVLELSANVVAGDVWQNLSVEKYREQLRVDVLPFVVLANPPSPGLAAVEEKPDTGVARHQEYALTWFSLAATVVVLWLVVNLRRDRT